MLILLQACAANTTEVRTVSDYCLIAKGIGYASPNGTETAENKFDTPLTVAEIEVHNNKYESLCNQPR